MSSEKSSPDQTPDQVDMKNQAETKDQAEPKNHSDQKFQHVSLSVKSNYLKAPLTVNVHRSEPLELVKQNLLSLGQLVQPLTSFTFSSDPQGTSPLNLSQSVGDHRLESGASLYMQPQDYNEAEMLLHLRLCRELVGFPSLESVSSSVLTSTNAGGTNLPNFKFASKSNQKVKHKTKDNFENNIPIAEIVGKPPANDPPLVVRGLHLSGWNPVTPRNRLAGHLMYIKFIAMDGKVSHILGHTKGFTQVSSTDDKFDMKPKHPKGSSYSHISLFHLLAQISPGISAQIEKANKALQQVPQIAWLTPRSAFLAVPWIVKELQAPTPDYARTQTMVPVSQSQAKNWIEEFVGASEISYVDDEGNLNIREKILRDRLLVSITSEFAVAATKGAVDIVHGNCTPLNPAEPPLAQIFLVNNIFYMYALDSSGSNAHLGGDEASHKLASKDVYGVEQTMRMDIMGLSPVLTAVIDYCGRRIVAQSPVPGIFNEASEPNIVYGTTENNVQVKGDKEMEKKMENISTFFHMKPHDVCDQEGTTVKLVTSSETKGMIGSDSRNYVLDLARITPLDLNFLEQKSELEYPHKVALLRPELVSKWFKNKVSGEIGNPEELDITKYNEFSDKFRLNPDTSLSTENLTKEESQDREDVKEACTFLTDSVIPAFIQKFKENQTSYPLDGVQLTQTMHRSGLNMRYLGVLEKLSRKEPVLNHLNHVVKQEAAIRAFKHIVRREIMELSIVDSQSKILDLFKAVKSLDQDLLARLEKEALKRFRMELAEDWASKILPSLSFFRQASLMLGLQWSTFDNLDDSSLITIVPKTYYAAVRSSVSEEALEARTVRDENGELNHQLIEECLPIFEQVYDTIHPEVARAHNQAALSYYEDDKFERASELTRRAIILAERTLGVDSSDTLVMYCNLAVYERARGQHQTAIEIMHHVLSIWRQLGYSLHPDLISILSNLGGMFQETKKFSEALECYNDSLQLAITLYGERDVRLSAKYFKLAQPYVMLQDYASAARAMEKAYTINKHHHGDSDESTVECKKWLDRLLAATIRESKIQKIAIPAQEHKIEPKTVKSHAFKGSNIDDIVNYITGGNEKKKASKRSSPKHKSRGN